MKFKFPPEVKVVGKSLYSYCTARDTRSAMYTGGGGGGIDPGDEFALILEFVCCVQVLSLK